MKILVIINNHNSIAIIDLCQQLKNYEDIEIMTVSEQKFEPLFAGILKKKKCELAYLDSSEGVLPNSSLHALESRNASSLISSISAYLKTHVLEASSDTNGSIRKRIASYIVTSSLICLAREKVISRNIKKYKDNALRFLDKWQPDFVLSMSDRSHDRVESAVLWAANRRRIKVVLPYVANYDINTALMYRRDSSGRVSPELHVFKPFSLYKLFSYFKLKSQVFQNIFFQPPYILNAHRENATLSAYSWWVGNGYSDIVCVNSDYTAKKYERHCVPKDKIAVIGDVAYDKVFHCFSNRERVRQAVIKEYSFERSKKLLIVAVPQWAEQGYIDWEKHWDEINVLVKEVCSSNNNVLLSVHPRSDITKYLFLEDRYKCRISKEPLSEIVAAADLFIASNSSTVVWAVLCGVPSIDYVSPAPPLYNYLSSVCYVDSRAKLRTTITKIFNSPEVSFKGDWELLSRNRVFDGLFCQRFIQMLKSNIN